MAYIPHPQHRNTAFASQKSQWTIAEADEHRSYEMATIGGWSYDGCYWSLHLIGTAPAPLGVSPFPNNFSLHIAKFVGDPAGDWHGYPVAPWLSPFDKPDTNVLISWLNAGLIGRPTMAKIKRGKRCAL
jgi:hypothetical protein